VKINIIFLYPRRQFSKRLKKKPKKKKHWAIRFSFVGESVLASIRFSFLFFLFFFVCKRREKM